MNNDKRLEIIFNHIKNGVEFISTDNVFIDETVRIGKHTIVYPDQYIRGEYRDRQQLRPGHGKRH